MDGILLLNKPSGISSYGMIRRLKRIFDTKKIGHGGTLDPFAEGLLVIAVNQGTKIIGHFLDGDKGYVAKLKFGEMTDTYDLTGEAIKTSEKVVAEPELKAALNSFLGKGAQVPPMFSAKKVNGQKLYKMARKGIEVERKEVTIDIREITLEKFDHPYATIAVRCSKGTYIRSLANDIGIKLGTYAHLVELKRTLSGPFSLDSAYELHDLEKMKEAGGLNDCLISLNDALSFLPSLVVNEDAKKKIKHGVGLTDEDIEKKSEGYTGRADEIKLVSDDGELVALVTRAEEENGYKYKKVFIR